ncbi:hypothetical protein D3C72_2202720 [compost metagenome]
MQAAVVGIVVGGEEAGLGERVPGGPGFRDQADFLAVEGRLIGIALLVVRGEVLGGDAACGFQGGVEHGAVMLGVARTLEQGLGVEQFIELEAQLAFVE